MPIISLTSLRQEVPSYGTVRGLTVQTNESLVSENMVNLILSSETLGQYFMAALAQCISDIQMCTEPASAP